jgi:uncharacterized repeat protein (TIGR01451 family)
VATGQLLTYSIVVRNAGPGTALAVAIADPLPTGTVFIDCTTSQGSCAGPAQGQNGTVTFDVGSLASGASITATIQVEVTAVSGQLLNTATVTTSSDDTDPDNNSSSTTSLIGGSIPTLSGPMLALLALALAALGILLLRRTG